jgi:hypothetical protein
MHIFGQKAASKNSSSVLAKLKDKSIKAIILGYAKDHSNNVPPPSPTPGELC